MSSNLVFCYWVYFRNLVSFPTSHQRSVELKSTYNWSCSCCDTKPTMTSRIIWSVSFYLSNSFCLMVESQKAINYLFHKSKISSQYHHKKTQLPLLNCRNIDVNDLVFKQTNKQPDCGHFSHWLDMQTNEQTNITPFTKSSLQPKSNEKSIRPEVTNTRKNEQRVPR